ncbi:MAG: protein-disulfide reductase DsbD domain-containing protein, partial [Pseudomonadota bacterium]
MKLRLFTLMLLLLSSCITSTAVAVSSGPVERDHIVVNLVSEVGSAQPGQSFRVGLWMQHAPNWHTYWQNPGDSGLQTRFNWRLPDGLTAGPIQWPYPERIPIEPLVNYGYSNEILLPVELQIPDDWPTGEDIPITLTADWLICEVECIPGKAELNLTVPTRTSASLPSEFAGYFERADARMPEAVDWPARFSTDGDQLGVQIELDARLEPDHLQFFPAEASLVEHAAEPFFGQADGLLQIAQPLSPFFRGAPEVLEIVLVDTNHGQAYAFNATPDSL